MKVKLPNYGTTSVNWQNRNNKLNIIIHDDKKWTCTLIDEAIPGDTNVFNKEADKIFKI